ncbi:MAG: hypothetical protein H6876_08630 [Hyphomicrobiaceae bacterium]|nr:hypothetical protein [Hyphomicrobiaceae bacterium]
MAKPPPSPLPVQSTGPHNEPRELFAIRDLVLSAAFVELKLHDIQFVLCEYDKYERLRERLAAKEAA